VKIIRKVPTVTLKKATLTSDPQIGMVQTETIANLTAIYNEVRNELSIRRICPGCNIEMGRGEGIQYEPDWNPIFRDVMSILGESPIIQCHKECEELTRTFNTEELARTQGSKFYELWTKLRR
jgi:hypothetical protein